MKIEDFTNITKALADSHRVRALMALRSGELCVCQIIELLELAPSTVSKHMSVLKHAGLVDSRKRGRWNYFRLAAHDETKILHWLKGALANSPTILADERGLKHIARKDLGEICKKQRCIKR